MGIDAIILVPEPQDIKLFFWTMMHIELNWQVCIIIILFLYALVTPLSFATDNGVLPSSEKPFPPLNTNVHYCSCLSQSVYHILVKGRYFLKGTWVTQFFYSSNIGHASYYECHSFVVAKWIGVEKETALKFVVSYLFRMNFCR